MHLVKKNFEWKISIHKSRNNIVSKYGIFVEYYIKIDKWNDVLIEIYIRKILLNIFNNCKLIKFNCILPELSALYISYF